MAIVTGRLETMDNHRLPHEADDEEQYRTLLRHRAERRRDELAEAMRERQRLDQTVERLKSNIEHLNLLLRDEGLQPVDVDHLGQHKPRIAFGAPGNRSGQMPARRERFVVMSLPDAVEVILTENGEMHANEIVRAVFDVPDNDPAQFRAAKQNLGSTLSRKAAEGRWQRADRPNTYRPNPETYTQLRPGGPVD